MFANKKVSVTSILLIGVVLAACGSSSSSSPTATKPSIAPINITLAKAVGAEEFVGADVAQQLGYFKAAGLNVKIETLAGSSVANSALQSGSVQFVEASSTSLLLAAAHNIPLLSVGSLNKGDPTELVVANSWLKAHNLSINQPLATRIKGLAGSTMAVISISDESMMSEFENFAGLAPSSVKQVSMSSTTSLLAAVQHGLATEFVASPPTPSLAVTGGYATVLANAQQLPLLSDEIYTMLITTPAYAKAHAAVVKAMIGAFQKALSAISQQTPAALAAVGSVYPTLSPAAVKDSLKSINYTPTMTQTKTEWGDALKIAQDSGALKPGQNVNITEGTVWTNQFSG